MRGYAGRIDPVRRRRFLIVLFSAIAVIFLTGLGFGIAWALTKEKRHEVVRGNSTKEFITSTTRPTTTRPPVTTTSQTTTKEDPPPKPKRRNVVWPTYGYDVQRTHVSPSFGHRPPFRRKWLFETGNLLEYPPAVAYGKVYAAQVKGRFVAIDARTGKAAWEHKFGHCTAAGPTVWRGIVFQTYMQPLPCDRFPRDQPGFLVAMDADTGKILWRFETAVTESSPLVVDGTVYFGSWDHHLYAVNARTKTLRWKFEADGEVNTSAAYWDGKVYFASDSGSLYALDAKTGREVWRRQDGTEYFYATPTIAYGRVYIGNTDGTLFSYGARSGDLLWAQHAGSYIYTAAAVWEKTVYVGSYDGGFYAFDAATGDRRWRHEAPSVIHGAPTVLDGLVYFSSCEFCGVRASRYAKQGPRGTFALDARSGRLVWETKAGQYSPIVADRRLVYLTGKTRIYALEPVRRTKRK